MAEVEQKIDANVTVIDNPTKRGKADLFQKPRATKIFRCVFRQIVAELL